MRTKKKEPRTNPLKAKSQKLKASSQRRLFSASQHEKGFTLVEMLVAVALFAIVLVIALGSIITIIDANRKARSLNLVMNNLNFALESMTRTIKTSDPGDWNGGGNSFTVEDQDGEDVTYSYDSINKTINKTKGNVSGPIISPEVEIDYVNFARFVTDDQPRMMLFLEGVARVSPRISSTFNIQTTVSPRKLNIGN